MEIFPLLLDELTLVSERVLVQVIVGGVHPRFVEDAFQFSVFSFFRLPIANVVNESVPVLVEKTSILAQLLKAFAPNVIFLALLEKSTSFR